MSRLPSILHPLSSSLPLNVPFCKLSIAAAHQVRILRSQTVLLQLIHSYRLPRRPQRPHLLSLAAGASSLPFLRVPGVKPAPFFHPLDLRRGKAYTPCIRPQFRDFFLKSVGRLVDWLPRDAVGRTFPSRSHQLHIHRNTAKMCMTTYQYYQKCTCTVVLVHICAARKSVAFFFFS